MRAGRHILSMSEARSSNLSSLMDYTPSNSYYPASHAISPTEPPNEICSIKKTCFPSKIKNHILYAIIRIRVRYRNGLLAGWDDGWHGFMRGINYRACLLLSWQAGWMGSWLGEAVHRTEEGKVEGG